MEKFILDGVIMDGNPEKVSYEKLANRDIVKHTFRFSSDRDFLLSLPEGKRFSASMHFSDGHAISYSYGLIESISPDNVYVSFLTFDS